MLSRRRCAVRQSLELESSQSRLSTEAMPCDERTKHYAAALDSLKARFDHFPREAMETLFEVAATHELFIRFASAVAERNDLSFAGFRVLTMIAKEEDARCPMHRLSEWLFVSRQNITGLVDVLEKKGLVRRIACGSDRRVKWVELTAEGREALDEVLPNLFASTSELFGTIPAAELERLVKTLRRLRERILTVGPELEPSFRTDFAGSDGPSASGHAPRATTEPAKVVRKSKKTG